MAPDPATAEGWLWSFLGQRPGQVSTRGAVAVQRLYLAASGARRWIYAGAPPKEWSEPRVPPPVTPLDLRLLASS